MHAPPHILSRQMGARASVHAEERLSEEAHVRALTRCYEEMLAAKLS